MGGGKSKDASTAADDEDPRSWKNPAVNVATVGDAFRTMITTMANSAQTLRRRNKRLSWLKSTDIFDVRVSTNYIDDLIVETYFQAFMEQCTAQHHNEAACFSPNEEFQSVIGGLEENLARCAADVEAVAQKHLHDIVDVASTIVDGYGGAHDFLPVAVYPGIGRVYIRHGFFFFLWETYVGEKFGRLELRNCRRLLELQLMGVHVPLTYHLVYKGLAVTAQAMVPLQRRGNHGRLYEQDSDEVTGLVRQIASAFNLLPFEEERGVFRYLSNAAHVYQGRDGRLYFLRNCRWSPPWLSSKGERQSPEQHFSVVRQELLVRHHHHLSCRAFQRDSLASENAHALSTIRKLMDQTIHDVPKVLGTVAETGPDSVLIRFRKMGFNYSMLGVLLLTLFRNVTPPAHAVRTVVTEMFVRGIKQYVMSKCRPQSVGRVGETVNLSAGRNIYEHLRGGGGDGGLRGLLAATTTSNPDASLRMGASMSSRRTANDGGRWDPTVLREAIEDQQQATNFIDFVGCVLQSLLQYEGAPRPRPATAYSAAVLPPNDLFGGEILPTIYRKYRLLPQDINLYGRLDDDQKMEIYRRVAKSLGVIIQDGQIKRVMPVVLSPGVPLTVGEGNKSCWPPEWLARQTDFLCETLLERKASRKEWLQYGCAIVPLLRRQSYGLQFYPQVQEVLTTLIPSPTMLVHVLQCTFTMKALEESIVTRQNILQKATSGIVERRLLIHLLRKKAAALYDGQAPDEAVSVMQYAIREADVLLESLGNHFGVQYRRITSEFAYYRGNEDFGPESYMLRVLARYCEPDVLAADDFLQLAVVHARRQTGMTAVDIMEIEWDLSRAVRLYAMRLGESHPKTIRSISNLAVLWLHTGRKDDALNMISQLVIDTGSECPSDIKAIFENSQKETSDSASKRKDVIHNSWDDSEHVEMEVPNDNPTTTVPTAAAAATLGASDRLSIRGASDEHPLQYLQQWPVYKI